MIFSFISFYSKQILSKQMMQLEFDNKINQVFFISNFRVLGTCTPISVPYLKSRLLPTKGTCIEKKRLARLYLSETYQGQPGTRPPSCTTPRQLTIHSCFFVSIQILFSIINILFVYCVSLTFRLKYFFSFLLLFTFQTYLHS